MSTKYSFWFDFVAEFVNGGGGKIQAAPVRVDQNCGHYNSIEIKNNSLTEIAG